MSKRSLGRRLARKFMNRFGKTRWLELISILANQHQWPAEKRRIHKPGDPLRTVIGESIESNFAPAFAPEGRDIVDGKRVTIRRGASRTAALRVQDLYRIGGISPGH